MSPSPCSSPTTSSTRRYPLHEADGRGLCKNVQSSILGSEVVEGAAIQNYGCLDCTPVPGDTRLLAVRNLVEKPKRRPKLPPRTRSSAVTSSPHASSTCSKPSRRAQAASSSSPTALRPCSQYEKVFGFSFEGTRHDAGDKLGFLKATVEFALKRDDLGPPFRAWLKKLPPLNACRMPVPHRRTGKDVIVSGSLSPIPSREVQAKGPSRVNAAQNPNAH